MENLNKNREKIRQKLRTMCPTNHENFKNSKHRVQFYWFLRKKSLIFSIIYIYVYIYIHTHTHTHTRSSMLYSTEYGITFRKAFAKYLLLMEVSYNYIGWNLTEFRFNSLKEFLGYFSFFYAKSNRILNSFQI